ncbi:MAG TPA: tRNA (adenosine(37)-N6)-threonylcarbamoyltransferase complex dimerization subunit type 1 TsaB [Gammaproteobacteria bacterium]|nr:tRNA (adenosine(37)-N6)-threonylcarbamoyltransferase complex dimerization subunit type 1 TsaB [Gammaproteobacteria bacterium]
MSRILAIEAATEACSVALIIGDEVRERFEIAPRRHVALLLPFVETLLAEAGTGLTQLDAIAFGRGPGSFTGLRIAAGMTQGMAFGADLPVIPVSTLAALAQGAVHEQGGTQVLAALDARMQEVYWGAFIADSDGLVQAQGEERVCVPAQVDVPQPGDWIGTGSGWDTYGEVLAARCALAEPAIRYNRQPHAADVARLAAGMFAQGGALPPEQAIPVYLRDNVADKPKPRA